MTVFVISLIRTVTPSIVGAFFAWLLSLGVVMPVEAELGLISFLFAVFTGLYYLVVRLLEEKFPELGILLGFAKSPDSYTKGPGVEITSKPGNELNITVNNPNEETTEGLADLLIDRVPGPDHRAQ